MWNTIGNTRVRVSINTPGGAAMKKLTSVICARYEAGTACIVPVSRISRTVTAMTGWAICSATASTPTPTTLSTTIGFGNRVYTGRASEGLPVAAGSRDANGNPVINIQQNAKDPVSPLPQFLTPAITSNLNIRVPQDASNARVVGTTTVYPAQEVNVTRADGTTTAVWGYNVAEGATPVQVAFPSMYVDNWEVKDANGNTKYPIEIRPVTTPARGTP